MSNEGHILAMVNNDQERDDVSTTASDKDVNPRWLKVSTEAVTQEDEDGCPGDARLVAQFTTSERK